MSDFDKLDFISLQPTLEQERIENSDYDGLEGIACLNCGDGCPGFTGHAWRRGCGNCKCPLWEHDIKHTSSEHPFSRMGIEETMPPLSSEYDIALGEGYAWVPRGLKSSSIRAFMQTIPNNRAPASRSEGARYRNKQLLYQLPRQDFSIQYGKTMDSDAKASFCDLQELRKDAIGIGAVCPSLTTPSQCDHCNRAIDVGRPAVFSEKMGRKKCWHPQCFMCSTCDNLLVDLVHFVKDGNIYCGRHWTESWKPRCSGCDEIIHVGEYTVAMDKNWHPEHFGCSHCDVPLNGKKYIVQNKKPYCDKCYTETLANKCYQCHQMIGPDGKDLLVKERHYHAKCLKCNKCNNVMKGTTFTYVNNELICNDCSGTSGATKCAECNGAFDMEERKVGIKGGDIFYHERCFVCSDCRQPIGSQQFVQKADNRKICNSCFDRDVKICSKCNDPIKTSSVNFEGKPFHSTCFTCDGCSKQLGGIPFYKHENKAFCENCYTDRHSKQCEGCHKSITGNVKFVDFENQFWHNDCFVCRGCHAPLAGSKFTIRDQERYCVTCK